MFRRRTPKPPGKAARAIFHAVSVEADDLNSCCTAVIPLLGKRFLSEDAPRLPVESCTSSDCQCTYQHYSDRRTQLRRDTDVGLPGHDYTKGSVRSGVGRRVTD